MRIAIAGCGGLVRDVRLRLVPNGWHPGNTWWRPDGRLVHVSAWHALWCGMWRRVGQRVYERELRGLAR